MRERHCVGEADEFCVRSWCRGRPRVLRRARSAASGALPRSRLPPTTFTAASVSTGAAAAGRIVSVLQELDCDLYALQEVDNQPGDHEESMQLERFARDMKMTAVPGLRIVRHTGEYGNAILTRLPVLSVRRHDLSHSWFEPRGALDVQVEVAGQPLASDRDTSGTEPFRAPFAMARADGGPGGIAAADADDPAG